MDETAFKVSARELFYGAIMLGMDRLVNVEYDFPTDDERLLVQLDETKQSMHKKKLLRENSKGEVTLDFMLSACVAFCARPDDCSVLETDGVSGTVYHAAGSFMLLESDNDDEYTAHWFKDADSVDGYITQRQEETSREGILDGGS